MDRTLQGHRVTGIAREIVGDLELRRYIDIVQALAARNLKTRYRGSILGIYWSLSNPLFMTVVYSAIFGTAFASHYNNSIVLYATSCFCGLALLNFFSQTTGQALPSIVSNGALLNKLRLPVSVFPVATLLANTFQLVVGVLPVLAIVTLITSHSLLNVAALCVPVLSLIMITIAFAFITSALFVYFRDLQYLYELFMFLLFLTSPIFYPIELVPSPVRRFVEFSPFATMVSSVRDIAISGSPPHVGLMLLSITEGIAALAIGILLFLSVKNDFMDLL